jgi:hypothetical protein
MDSKFEIRNSICQNPRGKMLKEVRLSYPLFSQTVWGSVESLVGRISSIQNFVKVARLEVGAKVPPCFIVLRTVDNDDDDFNPSVSEMIETIHTKISMPFSFS